MLHKHWEHSPLLRLSWNCLEPGQVNRDFARLRIPPWFPSRGGSPVFPSAKAPSHRPQRSLWERPGQARAWGCQGREKGLGLNENQLPDCNDFILYLLLSAIQSLSYFYPAEAARSFLQWLFKQQWNHWTVWEYFQQGMVLHASEGNGKIARRLWYIRIMLWLLLLLLFPYKSHSPHLGAAHISFLSSLGHYILELFKTNECRKCNFLFSTKNEFMSWLLLQTKQKSQGCRKGLHFAKQQGVELAVLQWGGGGESL